MLQVEALFFIHFLSRIPEISQTWNVKKTADSELDLKYVPIVVRRRNCFIPWFPWIRVGICSDLYYTWCPWVNSEFPSHAQLAQYGWTQNYSEPAHRAQPADRWYWWYSSQATVDMSPHLSKNTYNNNWYNPIRTDAGWIVDELPRIGF